MSETCIIFDLDGTLVDSETLCNQAFIDLLPEVTDPVEQLVRRYRGRKLTLILSDLEQRVGRKLPGDFEAAYRERVAELFEQHLRPMPGVIEMLEGLDRPKCIASSGPPKKMAQALEVSGLAVYFGSSLFSSYEIGSWKPDPGLFQHAAQQMGFAPEKCIVVEDSPVGLEAARAAGMTVVHFAPHAAEKTSDAIVLREMARLPELLTTLEG